MSGMGELTTAVAEKPFLVFGKPDIGEAEKAEVLEVLGSGWLSTGQKVAAFEEEFQRYMGRGHAVAVSSCTDGLILSLVAAKVRPGDEVITTPLTFAATVNAILAVGAVPVFVDVTESGHIDPEQIEEVITDRTAAILPVHYTGSACDMGAILDVAKWDNLPIIEDAAHAFGGTYPKEKTRIGNLGDFACFSFYPTKNITCGEGGMVVVHDEAHAHSLRTMSRQGLSAGAHARYSSGPILPYHVAVPGRKANMSDLHAAVGLAQIRRWDEIKERRGIVWEIYETAFGKKEEGHSQHLFTISSGLRDRLRDSLNRAGIGTGIHFRPLHLEPAYSFLRYREGDFPVAEGIGRKTLSLPVSPTMTADDARRVVSAVHDGFSQILDAPQKQGEI